MKKSEVIENNVETSVRRNKSSPWIVIVGFVVIAGVIAILKQ
jgi:hypothetical protein